MKDLDFYYVLLIFIGNNKENYQKLIHAVEKKEMKITKIW